MGHVRGSLCQFVRICVIFKVRYKLLSHEYEIRFFNTLGSRSEVSGWIQSNLSVKILHTSKLFNYDFLYYWSWWRESWTANLKSCQLCFLLYIVYVYWRVYITFNWGININKNAQETYYRINRSYFKKNWESFLIIRSNEFTRQQRIYCNKLLGPDKMCSENIVSNQFSFCHKKWSM